MRESKAIRIEVRGIVQGVGFRPFVYRLAREHGITGWVENTAEGVHVLARGGERELRSFLEDITRKAPPASVIEEVRALEVPEAAQDPSVDGEFRIRESSSTGERLALVSPDLATCPDCRRELFDPLDRRHRYPFINCTNCGPRFTIIGGIPYDRPMTTMAKFAMCPECRREYEDPANRRYHAQPNACPACGPRVWLEDDRGRAVPGDPLVQAARALRAGKIVAVKGLGGFQLACDATSDEAVSRLRERKRRYAK
ncbi:acylphosphatase, partial [Candidatus Solincola tengchongensis]|uniref:acylphosphatase n=1 Tax=Candidatus Solincola tengchongensis TaxID=2900693 RepID=UPI00257F4419